MLICKTIEIDMGHRVPNHKSKCKNLHGHRYKIEVGIDDKVNTLKGESNEGMVIDFGDLKAIMLKEIDERFDHGFVIYSADNYKEMFDLLKADGMKIISVPFIPTVENLAMYWFKLLDEALESIRIKLYHVKVWETPNSTAIYTQYDSVNYGK